MLNISELIEKLKTGDIEAKCVYCPDPLRIDEPFSQTPWGLAHISCLHNRIQVRIETKPWGVSIRKLSYNVDYFLTSEVK